MKIEFDSKPKKTKSLNRTLRIKPEWRSVVYRGKNANFAELRDYRCLKL